MFSKMVRSANCRVILATPIKTRKVEHRPALTFDQLPDYLERLEDVSAGQAAKGALELLLLRATRSGEVRGMPWAD